MGIDEIITQYREIVICFYYYNNLLTQKTKQSLKQFIEKTEDTLKQQDTYSSHLHDDIHNYLLQIFSKYGIKLYKEQYFYGYTVDEFFVVPEANKKYIIEVNGPVHFKKLDCIYNAKRDLRERIFKLNGFQIIDIDFKTNNDTSVWNRLSQNKKESLSD